MRIKKLLLGLALLLAGCAGAAATADVPVPTATPAYLSIPRVFIGGFATNEALEFDLGFTFPVQLVYHAWGNGFNGSPFTLLAPEGVIVMATWEYRHALSGPQDPYVFKPLQAVLDGEHDEYLYQFARDARAFGRPFFLRFGHEMNGDWYQWGGIKNGGEAAAEFGDPTLADGPERFVAAYRYIHEIFNAEGAGNVLWVWCPNIAMQGELGAAWNHIANYYPGDEYVDWLCMDGYNWGSSQDWSSWQSFDQVFGETYAQLQALNASKPMMIGETASSEQGGDKAAWIRDAFERLQVDYPQVRLLVWFNLNKETDWRINSSPASLEAFKEGLGQHDWGTIPWPGLASP